MKKIKNALLHNNTAGTQLSTKKHATVSSNLDLYKYASADLSQGLLLQRKPAERFQ